ncbi:MAG: cation:proton antiporter [Candidatus Marinimicrobia bacterium]|nr:cation:proton antiporter [Candidatus Neomarinimicrobiota bacterium]
MDSTLVIALGAFFIVALAAKQIGGWVSKINLPLITGFLFTGIIVGPYVLNLVPAQSLPFFKFIDETALAFIAFAAGGEFILKEFRARIKSMLYVSAGLIFLIFPLTSGVLVLFVDLIPFMADFPLQSRIGIGVMAGSILVAISPSSAIAIVRELHAKGSFTRTVLGVTVIIDVAVIILFTINLEVASNLLTGKSMSLLVHIKLLLELSLAVILGRGMSYLLGLLLARNWSPALKSFGILTTGYLIFQVSEWVLHYSTVSWGFDFHMEPLLIAVTASFWIVNRTPYRDEWLKLLHDIGPSVYIAFFTLTGISLSLDVLLKTWMITVILFAARFVGIFLGSYLGGKFAKDAPEHYRIHWAAFITQAGVGLGLAKGVAVSNPGFGAEFATIIISVIVLNQLVGPPLFKWALKRVGETHVRGTSVDHPDHDVIIFGVDNQGVTLAHQLTQHGWNVQLLCTQQPAQTIDVEIRVTDPDDLEALKAAKAAQADVVVLLLSDEENLALCRTFYEKFGTETIVVRLSSPDYYEAFHEMGALIVEPKTAMVSLMEQFVRSPSSASLLLGKSSDQIITDVEVRDPYYYGMAVRDLRLPGDVLILSMHRHGRDFISHGYNHFRAGDKLTLMGSNESLEDVRIQFEETST